MISRTWERVCSRRAWIEGALLAQPIAAALHAAGLQWLFDLDRSTETEICSAPLATPLLLLHQQRASGDAGQRKTSIPSATAVPLPCHPFLLALPPSLHVQKHFLPLSLPLLRLCFVLGYLEMGNAHPECLHRSTDVSHGVRCLSHPGRQWYPLWDGLCSHPDQQKRYGRGGTTRANW